MKNLLLILLTLIPLTMEAQGLKFRLEGNIDLPVDTMEITIVDADTKKVLGKTKTIKGQIMPVEGETEEPAACLLDTDKGFSIFPVMLGQGTTRLEGGMLKVGNMSVPKQGGTPMAAEMNEMHEALDRITHDYMNRKITEEEVYARADSIMRRVVEKHKDDALGYFAACEIYRPLLKPEQSIELIDMLAQKYKQKELVRRWKSDLETQIDAESGNVCPNIETTDINGKPFSLSSLRGKYVVFDFWGSWCGWCIKGFPKMKEYYGKYRDCLEIVGVDCLDEEADWRKIVKANALPWQHIRSTDGSIETQFKVRGYPHKVIIDPQGKIVKTFTGETEDFYSFIDKLMASVRAKN